jgi:hypothetical protein
MNRAITTVTCALFCDWVSGGVAVAREKQKVVYDVNYCSGN